MSDQNWEVSFEGLAIRLRLRDGALTWSAWRNGAVLTDDAPIRLGGVDGGNLLHGLSFQDTEKRNVGETYELVVGKRVGKHHVRHRERTVRFATDAGADVSLVLRAAPDGVALRLTLQGMRGTSVRGSDVHLRFPATARTWPLTYTPWYETPRFSTSLDRLEAGDYGLPFLTEITENLYVLVAEADLDGRYGGSLARYSGSGELAFTLADDVNLLTDSVATPWRVLIAGDLPTIVASHLVEDLAPPATESIPGWARPGRAAWSWWSDFYSGAHLDKQLRMLEYAAERGWEYVLVDCGWDAAWMPELVSAASERGIGVFVWVAWDKIGTEEQRKQLAEWASWGVAQERYQWYDAVIAECRRLGLMVNFHGSVIPRGWARTYPHVMSYEAVRGAEYYVFYGEPLTAEHNTIVPFTRNVVGSADYTPVTFSAKGRETTEAHELALGVVLESGLLHFADEISEYQARPIAEAAIERMPAHWDETRLVDGRPGEYVVLARRTGEEWFIGAISAIDSVDVSVDLRSLGLRSGHHVTIVEDDLDGKLTQSEHRCDDLGTLSFRLRRNGGALCILSRASDLPVRERERPSVTVEAPLHFASAGTAVSIQAEIRGSEEGNLEVPPGWPAPELVECDTDRGRATFTWSVTTPNSFGPADVAVLAVHAGRPLTAERSVIAHARVAHPVGPGVTLLSRVRPIASRNGFGPVEIDMSNGGGDPRDGRPMSIAGHSYDGGLGVCAPSSITYALGGTAERFVVDVGVDDETDSAASAICRVTVDGRCVAEVTVAPGEQARHIEAELTGAQLLGLVVEQTGAGDEAPHIDWVAPRVLA
jgi:alpha-glucosidase